MTDRILKRRFYGEAMQFMLSSMLSRAESGNRILSDEGYSGRRVLGFKIPSWQRKPKWNVEQAVRFIESLYLGISPGAFMVNECMNNPEIDQILLDGQQRLMAIESYWNDEFKVAGEDGVGHCWSELTDGEKAHFLRMTFPSIYTKYRTEEECRVAYNRHNFGGTPHEESERA